MKNTAHTKACFGLTKSQPKSDLFIFALMFYLIDISKSSSERKIIRRTDRTFFFFSLENQSNTSNNQNGSGLAPARLLVQRQAEGEHLDTGDPSPTDQSKKKWRSRNSLRD